MAFSKSLGFVLLAALLISTTVAQSPAPAPSNVGGRRISPAPSPTKSAMTPTPATNPTQATSPSPASALTPESSPPSPPQADSPPSDSPAVTPSAISDSPTEAPGPAQSGAVSNRYAGFGSVAVMLTVAVLAM